MEYLRKLTVSNTFCKHHTDSINSTGAMAAVLVQSTGPDIEYIIRNVYGQSL